MPGQRGYLSGLCVVASLSIGLAAWWAAVPDQPVPDTSEAPIHVVSGRTDIPPAAAPVKAIGSTSITNAVPDMAQLTINERAELLDGRPRDAVWSTRTEAALLAQLRQSGVIPDVIRCADTLCSVQGTIVAVTTADRQRIVDQLVRGQLHPAYDRAGLAAMQAMNIDADYTGTLHVTEYLRRK